MQGLHPKSLALGAALSVVVHALFIWVGLPTATAESGAHNGSSAALDPFFRIDVAPEAPEAFDPTAAPGSAMTAPGGAPAAGERTVELVLIPEDELFPTATAPMAAVDEAPEQAKPAEEPIAKSAEPAAEAPEEEEPPAEEPEAPEEEEPPAEEPDELAVVDLAPPDDSDVEVASNESALAGIAVAEETPAAEEPGGAPADPNVEPTDRLGEPAAETASASPTARIAKDDTSAEPVETKPHNPFLRRPAAPTSSASGGVGTAIRDAAAAQAAATSGSVAGSPGGAESSAGPAAPAGAMANLSRFVPAGDNLVVLLRLDRLRDTPWAGAAYQILAPMPDYRVLVEGRDRPLDALFESILISTSDPFDLTATNLAARSALPHKEVQAYVNHRLAPVKWRNARGGIFGHRLTSKLKHRADPREFFLPFEDWAILTRPEHLGALTEPRTGDGNAWASTEDAPSWVTQVRDVEAIAGVETGPAVVVTASDLPARISLPGVTLRSPEHVTLAIEIAPTGLLFRGTMTFASESQAAQFLAKAEAERRQYLKRPTTRAFLQIMRAYNAVKGLSMRQNGPRVSFATSLSNADGKALTDKVAEVTERFYETRARKRDAPRKVR